MILSSKWMVLPVVLALTSAASEAWAARVAQPQGAIDARLGDRRASRQRTAGLSRQNRWSEQPGSSRGQSERRRAGHAKRAAVFCRPRHAVRSRARHESRPGQLCGIASGQRVIIQSQGAQAIRVRIFPRNQYAGLARRVATVQGPMTLPSNYHIHNISRAGATHVKVAKR